MPAFLKTCESNSKQCSLHVGDRIWFFGKSRYYEIKDVGDRNDLVCQLHISSSTSINYGP